MRISDLNPLNSNARKALAKTLRLFARRLDPRLVKPAPDMGAGVERVTRAAVGAVMPLPGEPRPPGEAEVRRRSASQAPPQVPGAGWIDLAWRFLDPDPEQQRRWGSEEALYGRFTTAAGPTPQAYSSQASVDLTVERLASIYAEANRDGYLTHYMDLNFEIHQKWGHLQSAHRQRTAATYRNPLQLRPRSKTPRGRFVCAFVRGVLDDIPGFLKAEEDLLSAARNGCSALEIIWQAPRTRRITVGRTTYTVQGAKAVESLEWVHPRNLRWDPIKRRMLLDVGGTRYIDPFTNPDGLPARKLILHGGPGEGDPHQRGYGFGVDLLYMLGTSSLARWAVALELFGVATPYMQYEGEGYANDGDVADAQEFVAALGRGQPAILHRKFGEVKLTETPQGIDARGQHAAILGYINSECSKHVAGQTLAMEIGGSGSYAAANVHSDSKEDVQIIDARLEADTQTHQTVRYIVEENAVPLARAFGCSPAEILAECPVAYRIVDRRMDPKDRLAVFQGVALPAEKGGLGLRVDPDQVAEELNVRLLEDEEEGGLPTPAAPAPAQRSVTLPGPMVMVALYPPHVVAQRLAQPGGVMVDELHVTLAYLGRSLSADARGALERALRELAAQQQPLQGSLGGIGLFPPSASSEGRAVAWVPTDVVGLAELRQAVVQRLAQLGLTSASEHGFAPHMTLAYQAPGAAAPDPVAPTPVCFEHLSLVWGGERLDLPFARRSLATRAGKWDEGDHPRADDGKFGGGGGGSGGGGAAEPPPDAWHPPKEGPPALRDHAHAHEWLEQNYPHVDCKLQGMHEQLLQGHVEQFHKLAQQHPEVARKMTSWRMAPPEQFSRPSVVAQVNSREGTITMNQALYSKPAALQERNEDRVQAGWFPKGTPAVEALMTHEFGHLVDAHIRDSSDPKKYAQWTKGNMTSGCASDYGRTHIRESFAESFRQLNHAPEKEWAPATRRLADLLKSGDWRSWKV